MRRFVVQACLTLTLWTAVATAQATARTVGVVLTMTNAAAGNSVVVLDRDQNGNLQLAHIFPTGGSGSGSGLGNAGGMVLTSDGRFLLVVNAGSNDISVFSLDGDVLRLVDRSPSGGHLPLSVTESRRFVYVLNAGGDVGDSDNVTGFRLSLTGRLTTLAHSTRPLSGTATGPAQVGFNRSGTVLTVTEKNTNSIDTYVVHADGLVEGPFVHASSATTPFGFAFDGSDNLLVSDAEGGASNASGLSSYAFVGTHGLSPITPFAPTNQTAACWVAVTPDGTVAFVTNTGSGTVSGFHVGFTQGDFVPLAQWVVIQSLFRPKLGLISRVR